MDNLIPVNITLADRSYRLKIESVDEEKLRKTVKLLNEKIIEFKTGFAGKDMQDYIAMTLIWFSTEQNKNGEEIIKFQEAVQKLKSLENLIDKSIDSK